MWQVVVDEEVVMTDKSMWRHPSTNYNSLYGQVVTFVVPLYVAQDLFGYSI